MPISFQCPKCGKTLSAKDDLAGKNANCPGCKQVMVIPAACPVPPAPATPLSSQVAPPPPLPSGSGSGARAKWTTVKDALQRREDLIKRKTHASNLRREVTDLEAALEGQFAMLGSLTLTNRPPVVDISAEVTELSRIQDETTQKQSILESLRQTAGSVPLVKEVEQEIAVLQSRKRTITVRIGSKTHVAQPEMTGTVGTYAAIARLRLSLTAKQNELKAIEEQIGTQGGDWGMGLPIKKIAIFAGAIAGGVALLCLYSMQSSRTHFLPNLKWFFLMGTAAFLVYLYQLGSKAGGRGRGRGQVPPGQTGMAQGRAIKCPLCGHEGLPVISKNLAGSGWVFFVILLLFCLPICWLPFVISGCKDETRKCAACGSKMG